jgi:phosphatidylinositol glycan class M
MPFALFAQTLAFVTFNKVCTAQYFVWWFMLLPLILPSLLKSHRRKHVIFSFSLWTITQLQWLAWAYSLEFKGMQVYRSLWIASLAFFGANIWFLVNIIDAYELVDVHGAFGRTKTE